MSVTLPRTFTEVSSEAAAEHVKQLEKVMVAAPPVQEVLGEYAARINGKVTMFPTYEQAMEAVTRQDKEDEFTARIKAYLNNRELVGKTAQQRANVILDFLTFEG